MTTTTERPPRRSVAPPPRAAAAPAPAPAPAPAVDYSSGNTDPAQTAAFWDSLKWDQAQADKKYGPTGTLADEDAANPVTQYQWEHGNDNTGYLGAIAGNFGVDPASLEQNRSGSRFTGQYGSLGSNGGITPVEGKPGYYTLTRQPAGNKNYNLVQAEYKVGADGKTLERVGDWKPIQVQSDTQNFQHFAKATAAAAAVAAGAAYGLGAEGVGAGVGEGAGAGLGEAAGAGIGDAAGSGLAIDTGASNPALIDSAMGTPGYGASSAGPGGGSGLSSGLSGDQWRQLGNQVSKMGDDNGGGGGGGSQITGVDLAALAAMQQQAERDRAQIALSTKTAKTAADGGLAMQRGIRGEDPIDANGAHIAAFKTLLAEYRDLETRFNKLQARRGRKEH